MDKNTLQPEQIEPVQKKGKVLKIVVIILLAIFVLTLILFFLKPHLFVTANIVDKKDSYKLGDTMILHIELKNYWILPFKNEFSPDSPQLIVEGIEPKIHFSSRAVPFGWSAESIDQIKPFESRSYTVSINLVNEKSWHTYAGELTNYDLVIKPGMNRINARWYKQVGFDIYIAPEDFYEDRIDCNLFAKPNRRDQCFSALALDGM